MKLWLRWVGVWWGLLRGVMDIMRDYGRGDIDWSTILCNSEACVVHRDVWVRIVRNWGMKVLIWGLGWVIMSVRYGVWRTRFHHGVKNGHALLGSIVLYGIISCVHFRKFRLEKILSPIFLVQRLVLAFAFSEVLLNRLLLIIYPRQSLLSPVLYSPSPSQVYNPIHLSSPNQSWALLTHSQSSPLSLQFSLPHPFSPPTQDEDTRSLIPSLLCFVSSFLRPDLDQLGLLRVFGSAFVVWLALYDTAWVLRAGR